MGLRGPGAKSGYKGNPDAFAEVKWNNPELSRAEKVIAFIESLKLTMDPWAGEPFLLREWQKEIIRAWYATNKENRLIVKTGLLSVARKNGKSGLCAGLAAAHLFGPEAVQRGQIVVGATDADQSGLIFDELVAFIEDNKEFSARCNIKSHEKTIINLENKTKFKALSSDAKKAHGLNPTVVILDELAQWGDGVGRRLYNALTTGQGARRDPLILIIGTQSDEDSALMSQLVDYAKDVNLGSINDPKFKGFVYEIPEEHDVFDPATWGLANPALGDFRSIEEMQDLADKARRLPTLESTFRNLYCNQRTQAEPGLITKEEWRRCLSTVDTLKKGEEIYIGLDLSGRADLTALVACSKNDGDRIKPWFWKPKDLLREHMETDRLEYDVWVKQGWIQAPKGRSIDYAHVAKTLAEIHRDYKICGLAYDRYRIDDFIRELKDIGVESYKDGDTSRSDAIRLVPWGQGYADMAPAVDAFELSVLEERLKHDGNPMMTICVANAKVDMDAAGNRKLDKSATRFRIDGAVALAMAVGLKARQHKQAEKKFQAFFIGK